MIELSAIHLSGETVDEDDEDVLVFHLCDELNGVDITHKFGNSEEAAHRLMKCAEAMRLHAERIRYRHRLRTVGWT